MTAPDGDRLPATNSGQETYPDRVRTGQVDPYCPEHGHLSTAYSTCSCPAPQQPPAQEREDQDRRMVEALERGMPADLASRAVYGDNPPAPPSEADSVGEDGRQFVVEMHGLHGPFVTRDEADRWAVAQVGDGAGSWEIRPLLAADSAGEVERLINAWITEVVIALEDATVINKRMFRTGEVEGLNLGNHDRLIREAHKISSAIAASPGVQSGDGEALHEWPCPNCGATTRARMADHDGKPFDHRLLDDRFARAADAVIAALFAAPGQEQP